MSNKGQIPLKWITVLVESRLLRLCLTWKWRFGKKKKWHFANDKKVETKLHVTDSQDEIRIWERWNEKLYKFYTTLVNVSDDKKTSFIKPISERVQYIFDLLLYFTTMYSNKGSYTIMPFQEKTAQVVIFFYILITLLEIWNAILLYYSILLILWYFPH